MRNCEANYTNVTIINGTGQVEVDDHQLYPGQTCMYEGMEYRIDITFYSGEAPACPICNDTCPSGPQSVSNFTIHIKTVNQPPATLREDLNHDGTITPADAVIALTIAASGGGNYNADIDGDGKVTSLDGLLILQAAADNIGI
ncbi:MAG: dockerin type I repeat-containing protein [Euryarchaeota archaeon]|nr:dockerin type I repeat-containing protein [Euryarchaeota archaeon]